jgi:hypothetical protein
MRTTPRDIRRLRACLAPVMLVLTVLANPAIAAGAALAWLFGGVVARTVIAVALVLAVPAAAMLPALVLAAGFADAGVVYLAGACAILRDAAADLPGVELAPLPALAHATADAALAQGMAWIALGLRHRLAERSVVRATPAFVTRPHQPAAATTPEVAVLIERRGPREVRLGLRFNLGG